MVQPSFCAEAPDIPQAGISGASMRGPAGGGPLGKKQPQAPKRLRFAKTGIALPQKW